MTDFESLKWSGDTLPIIIDVAIFVIRKQATKEEENRQNIDTVNNLIESIY